VASETRILASKAGVTLKEVTLSGEGRELDRAYSVTSERQPHQPLYSGSDENQARQAYEAEVAAIARIRNSS
jgi:hypothetical protein